MDETRDRNHPSIPRPKGEQAGKRLPFTTLERTQEATRQSTERTGPGGMSFREGYLVPGLPVISERYHSLIFKALKRAERAGFEYGHCWQLLSPRSLLEIVDTKICRALKAHDREDYDECINSLIDVVNYSAEYVNRVQK